MLGDKILFTKSRLLKFESPHIVLNPQFTQFFFIIKKYIENFENLNIPINNNPTVIIFNNIKDCLTFKNGFKNQDKLHPPAIAGRKRINILVVNKKSSSDLKIICSLQEFFANPNTKNRVL